jgi:hypothetical protein
VRASVTSGALTKPLDTGNGLLAASFGADGSWLSVGWVHERHGYAELSGMPPFQERWRGDPAAVRRYRAWLVEERFAFLWLEVAGEDAGERTAGVDDAGRPVWHRGGERWACDATAWAPAGRAEVVQRYVLRGAGRARTVFRLRGRLDRAAFAEITEVDPPDPLTVHTAVRLGDGGVTLDAPALPARIRVSASLDGGPPGRWTPDPAGGARFAVTGGAEVVVTVVVALEPAAGAPVRDEHAALPVVPGACPALSRITLGALRYVRGCTATAAGAILTDHRLLPLSWTRDAYYQARLLLAAGATTTVADHLRWLFSRARDPDGRWARSQLPDGRTKDRALQADQQLYPLLELADHRAATGGWPAHPDAGRAGTAWGPQVEQVWRVLPRAGPDGMLASEENPADDRAGLPFLLSTQILYWHTATRLAAWAAELGVEHLELGRVADELCSAVHRRFTHAGPFGSQWAYEVDGTGGHRLYQDANDLPTAFAPLWGFCAATDPSWAATMRFAFSPHNPGYVAGPFGGLGSAHTPGTWSLGDAQELAVALATHDRARLADVVRRLAAVAGVDGMLPETYDPHSGRWRARHWFAWPAAVIGTLHLEHLGPGGPAA